MGNHDFTGKPGEVALLGFQQPPLPRTQHTTARIRDGNLKCTLLSKLNLLKSLDSVALLSPCVSAPYQNIKVPMRQVTYTSPYTHLYKAKLTKLSSLLATIDANLCSPANSEIRKTYSGAVTWFDL